MVTINNSGEKIMLLLLPHELLEFHFGINILFFFYWIELNALEIQFFSLMTVKLLKVNAKIDEAKYTLISWEYPHNTTIDGVGGSLYN